jgi:hypothetical protein
MLSWDVGRDLKTEFLQLWVAMAMAAAMVQMGRRSGIRMIRMRNSK